MRERGTWTINQVGIACSQIIPCQQRNSLSLSISASRMILLICHPPTPGLQYFLWMIRPKAAADALEFVVANRLLMALSWRPLTTYQITGHIVAQAVMVHCRIPSHLLKRFFLKKKKRGHFWPRSKKNKRNFSIKRRIFNEFSFFFLSQQASNGINGRGERNGRDVTQVGSEFFFKSETFKSRQQFLDESNDFFFFFRV